MPNITINLDEETHRKAKILAAQRGTSLSKIFREHILRISSESESSKEQSVLEQYSCLKISAKDAMGALNLNCLEDLMLSTANAGLPLPHVDRKGAAQMAKNFLGAQNA